MQAAAALGCSIDGFTNTTVSCGGLEFEPETAAFARLGLDADIAIHPLGGFSDEGETNTGAFVTLIKLLKHVEDSLVVLLRDSNAVVFEPDADAGRGGSLN